MQVECEKRIKPQRNSFDLVLSFQLFFSLDIVNLFPEGATNKDLSPGVSFFDARQGS